MKFLRIKYKNYRCFIDAELSFKTDEKKNIALIVAPNGGGKTEMLFSFWWVLYNFNFKDLKGKEDTPYALNSALYRKLEDPQQTQKFDCSVELQFEYNDLIYIMKRIEVFYKTKNGIESEQTVELSTINEHGERSLPERDKEIVEKRLTDIIPKSILYGIIFDGERMKQLSSVDEVSKTAVEGVIKHITNEELFELCRTEFLDLNNKVSKELRRVAKKSKNSNLETVVYKLERFGSELNVDETTLKAKKERLEIVKSELLEISSELKRHESSKVYEERRIEYKKSLDDKNKDLDNVTDEFYKNLYEGYLLISKCLFEDILNSLEYNDIPFGLTVEAVKSILARPTCICGHNIDDESRKKMEALLETLPPDNISSTIREMLRQNEMHSDEVKDVLKASFNSIEKTQKEIEQIKKELAYVSSQISEDAPEIIKDLERRNKELVIEEDALNKNIIELENNIRWTKNRIEQLQKDKESCKGNDAEVRFFNAKYNYIQKCLKSLNEIDEFNKKISLENINSKINEAYSQMSEDHAYGRRLYIVQYDPVQKYRLVSYYQSNYEEMLKNFTNDGTIKSLEMIDKTDSEIKEYIILKVLESNSTGQSKINTLTFAKAILDYSNEIRDVDSTEITKNYPFLIDSPFTELTDDNLMRSSANLHNFTGQVILMSSEEGLASVKDSIIPYVGCENHLVKVENESLSIVKEGQ
ncbi:MAG: hypothetical protein K2K48_02005 [Anaeroplasmataceae bacterium]|nr:hypothetical protein [Anaeroplasmataceae bacterium]